MQLIRNLKTSRILVVIDMQPQGFPLSGGVTREVMREMRLAIANGWLIVVVEYDLECAGPTDSRILALLTESGYANWITVKKKAEDGSQEIAAALAPLLAGNQFQYAPAFRVVGVTTDDCVTKTVHGLLPLFPDCVVEVVTDACTNWEGRRYNWAAFSSSPQVILIAAQTSADGDSNVQT